MLSANATRSKSLAPLPVSTAASSGAPLCASCYGASLRSCTPLRQLLCVHRPEKYMHLYSRKMQSSLFAHTTAMVLVRKTYVTNMSELEHNECCIQILS